MGKLKLVLIDLDLSQEIRDNPEKVVDFLTTPSSQNSLNLRHGQALKKVVEYHSDDSLVIVVDGRTTSISNKVSLAQLSKKAEILKRELDSVGASIKSKIESEKHANGN